ncbi:HNH endonuclease [Phyllobacterium sp. P5_D12]
MARTVAEWIGKTDNTKAPPRVRQRIYDRDKGSCHLCKTKIKIGETWEADHVIALINGGSNTEGNLAPAHSHCHLKKTALDVKEKSKVAKVRTKHTGVKRPKGDIRSQGFAKSAKVHAPSSKSLPPRRLYQERT